MKKSFYIFLTAVLLVGCSSNVPLTDGQYEVKKVNIVTDNPLINTGLLKNYVTQQPGRKGGKKQHPILDEKQTAQSCQNLTTALRNDGYLDASVESIADTIDHRAEVTYILEPKQPYKLRKISYDIEDSQIDSILTADWDIHNRNVPTSAKGLGQESYSSELYPGEKFSVTSLNNERSLIVSHLQNNGYYRFTKDFIRFQADTVSGKKLIDLTLHLILYKPNNSTPAGPHPRYTVAKISYAAGDGEDIGLRKRVLSDNTLIEAGKPYCAQAVKGTYNRFGRLDAVRYSNIRFDEIGDSLLDCTMQLATSKPNTISFQPEGTNTAGNLGAAASLTFENRNLFHGSEKLSIELRGAYEAITGLEGYTNKNYIEYGLETKLTFPRLVAPFISKETVRRHAATSELSISYNLQNRPEFHRRVLRTAWRYRWSDSKRHRQWKFDLIDLNYIYMPWISETFKKNYLDSVSNRNAILRYNYEDLFIMKIGLGMTYSHGDNAFKWNIESSGNLLNVLAKPLKMQKNDAQQYTLFNIAYAQYIKGDIEGTHQFHLSPQSSFVIHGALGIAYPYGNSIVLPFEKRYFSGGANSVRGWSVRGLGPGTFKGSDGRIDFINQTGDIKLDLNMEYRTFLFWKFSGAAFIDAGNIWTIRNYADQPGGQFRLGEFYKQIAVAYGLGLRLNFGYFILRFDAGMKAVNPAYTTKKEHYPIIYPKLSRDFAFHFAVGLPF